MKRTPTVFASLYFGVLGAFALPFGCVSESPSAPIIVPPDAGYDVGVTDTGADSNVRDAGPPECDLNARFGAPKPFPEFATIDSDTARLTPDEKTIYFGTTASNPDSLGGFDIVSATRTARDKPFGSPTWLRTLNSPLNDRVPWVSANNRSLIYTSNRAGGDWQIWESQRSSESSAFGAGSVIPGTRVAGNNIDPFLLEGVELWFRSDNAGAGDFYRSTYSNGSFTSAAAMTEINSPQTEEGVVLSADGLTIFFGSNRSTVDSSSNLDYDIWTAKRPTLRDSFVSLTKLTELSDSSSNEWPSWLSPDGCRLYLTSDRTSSRVIYVAERPK